MTILSNLLLIAFLSVVDSVDPNPILTWMVNERNGFVSDKIESKGIGLFASEDIAKDEIVMKVPGDTPIRPDGYDHVFADGEHGTTDDHCLTAEKMAEEYFHLKNKSSHWPYLQHVFENYHHYELPLGWSEEGKQLLCDIAGPNDEIEPSAPPYVPYIEDCIDYDEDEEDQEWYDQFPDIIEASYRIVRGRGWEYEMVPAYDMFNHRNGWYRNVERANDPLESKDGEYIIVANRDIKAGEQMHISYSDCNSNDPTCYNTGWRYVTGGIFMDFGFVEQYPRRWRFWTEDGVKDIMFEENEKEVDGSTKVVITWHKGVRPKKKQIRWMKKQLARLQDLGIDERTKDLPDFEGRLAKEYWEAIVSALNGAIAEATPNSSSTEDERDGSASDEF